MLLSFGYVWRRGQLGTENIMVKVLTRGCNTIKVQGRTAKSHVHRTDLAVMRRSTRTTHPNNNIIINLLLTSYTHIIHLTPAHHLIYYNTHHHLILK